MWQGAGSGVLHWSIGVMEYSDNQEEAKAFLEWWFSAEPFQSWLEAYQGYILPPGPTFTDLGVYTEDPKLAPYIEVPEIARNKGFAGPANLKAAQVSSQYVIVNTFANAIQNGDAGAAIVGLVVVTVAAAGRCAAGDREIDSLGCAGGAGGGTVSLAQQN